MKDYRINKVWITAIADISEYIDRCITEDKNWLNQRKLDLANEEPENQTDWKFEQIEELEEKIKALEWTLNTINAPFKIKK